MRKKLLIISKMIIVIFLPIVILLGSLKAYALNEEFYMKEFKKYDIVQNIHINEASLHKIATGIVNYLKDDEKDLLIFIEKNGEYVEAFGQKEKLHMKDVKILFQRGYILKNISLFLVGFAFLIIIKFSNIWKDILGKSLIQASIISFVFIFFLYVLMNIDFYQYFIYFHKIFFNNNLWLLDPKTDLLIQILPLEFFIDIAQRTLMLFLGIMFLTGWIGFVLVRHVMKI
ncbi:TIGR01906 family membrane protein [Anaerophilus nitritogenes]|uniref:TIGR01906 family membrane protein n=1 Tax=Anaerophilus nitritogenes TaxID=2498136 RepID=UPI00101DC263|nr:TIGR01906 family membrane protein [Anaerophilus nitritogenes]